MKISRFYSDLFLSFRPDFIGIGIRPLQEMLKQVRSDNVGLICCFLFLLSAPASHAQKEDNTWTFPDRVSMNFNDMSNIIVDTSAIGPNGGFPLINQSTISDNEGNLFCYSAGTQYSFHGLYVYDRNHNIMPHGYNLQGHPGLTSLLVSFPGSDSLIYLFHYSRDTVNTNNFRLFYSIINKNLNGGLGDVMLRDSMILYGTLANLKLAICKHGNGRDWWLFTKDYLSDVYYYFLLTPNGIINMGTQNIGSNDHRVYGKLIFSNDGTKMMSVSDLGCLNVFDFDRCSGLLSNYKDIGEHTVTEATGYYSAAFSPDGNIIYVSPFYDTKVFYQWNLNAGTITDIRNSKLLLNEYPDTGIININYAYFWHNLAPNGKIYIPMANNYWVNGNTYVSQHLDVIENPDVPGIGCNYVRQGFSLNGKRVCGNMPNMAYFALGADSGSICDTLVHIGISEISEKENIIEVFPNPSSGIFSLQLKDLSDKIISVQVEDIFGTKVLSAKTFVSTFDISNKPQGIYFVHVKTQKKKMLAAKVIKE
jgi:hypothetical protein